MRTALVALSLCAGIPASMPAMTFAAMTAPAAAPVDLRPKWTVGTDTRLKIELLGDSEVSMAGLAEAQKNKDTQEIVAILRPRSVAPEGESKVELIYESMKFKTEGMRSFEWDSAKNEDSSPVAKALRPVIGTVLTLTIDANGNITNVTGGEAVAGASGMGRGRSAQMVSKPGVTSMFGPILTTKAAKGTASVGETWTTTDTMDLNPIGSCKLVAKTTLREMKGADAHLGIEGTLSPDESAAAHLKLEKGAYEGTAVWDTKGGMIKSADTTITISAMIDSPGGKTSVKRTAKQIVTNLGTSPTPAAATKPEAPKTPPASN